MGRIKIELPSSFSFSTAIPIRITDLNYGNHVGNDSILSIIHEARVRFLKKYGLEELNFGGVGLIMSDVAIEFKNEAFYEDELLVSVAAVNFSKVAFEIYYKLERKTNIIAIAKTGMVCYDYSAKRIVAIPGEVKAKLIG